MPSGLSVRREADEVAGNQLGSLVNQLVIGVLAVGAGRSPHDRAGLIVDPIAVQIDLLAVALHVELLQVGAEAAEVMIVGQDGDGLGREEVVVPNAQQAQQDRQIVLPGGGAKMFVHGVEAGEHVAKIVGPDGQHQRQPDGRVDRVAAADPVPKLEHVGRVDAELGNLGRVGRDGHEMPGDGLFAQRRHAATSGPNGRWSTFPAW